MSSHRSDPDIDPAAIRGQLKKILNSEFFSEAPRMARFLQFAVDETLGGKAQELKENIIGVHVFDRPLDYDTRIDPIVRVEARRLRLKLRAYYDGPGKADQLIFEFPKGQYFPTFRLGRENQIGTPDQPNTIAVLPFTNLSGGAETDFLCDELTEDLISALTRVSNLRVSAWTSAARMRGEQENLDTIRSVLGVTHVLRGSLRNTQDRIRILAHLIDTASRQYVWSETFDRRFEDIFAIQDEITKSIVVALRARLNARFAKTPVIGSATDLECYQLCLEGRFHAAQRTSSGLRRSVLCFERAVEVDPSSVSAYAGLADAYALEAEYGFTDGPTWMRKAKAAVERALALDPDAAEAHASYGLIIALYDWSWYEAEAAFRRSLELNPNYAPAHHWYAMNLLVLFGRFEEAAVEMEAALKLDPLSPIVKEGTGYLCFLRRDYTGAAAIYNQLSAAEPAYFKAYSSLGRAYLHGGEHQLAIEMLNKALSLAGEAPHYSGRIGPGIWNRRR